MTRVTGLFFLLLIAGIKKEEKELTNISSEHLDTTGPNADNSELYVTNILLNALNVKKSSNGEHSIYYIKKEVAAPATATKDGIKKGKLLPKTVYPPPEKKSTGKSRALPWEICDVN